MTTSIRVETSWNLVLQNEVMNLGQGKPEFSCVVAGASWLASESSPAAALLSAVGVVLDLVRSKLPKLELWLLVGSSAWQQDTRLVRYHRLWGTLKLRGLNLPFDEKANEEVMLESNGALKFFGAVALDTSTAADVVPILLGERCTYVVALPRTLPVRRLLEIGWSGDLVDDRALIDKLAGSNALLMKQVGEYDDPERGFVVIGTPLFVKKLLA